MLIMRNIHEPEAGFLYECATTRADEALAKDPAAYVDGVRVSVFQVAVVGVPEESEALTGAFDMLEECVWDDENSHLELRGFVFWFDTGKRSAPVDLLDAWTKRFPNARLHLEYVPAPAPPPTPPVFAVAPLLRQFADMLDALNPARPTERPEPLADVEPARP